MPARFGLGRVVATPGALYALTNAGIGAGGLLARHQSGDWGELDDHDRAVNEESLHRGTRLLSAYTLPTGVKLWIISYPGLETTLLLPDEY